MLTAADNPMSLALFRGDGHATNQSMDDNDPHDFRAAHGTGDIRRDATLSMESGPFFRLLGRPMGPARHDAIAGQMSHDL